MFARNIQSLIYEFFMNLHVGERNAINCLLDLENLDSISLRDIVHASNTKDVTLEIPTIIICSSDEIDLCYSAVSFLLTSGIFPNISKDKGMTSNTFIKSNINDAIDIRSKPIVLPDIRLSAYDSTLSFYEEIRELFAKILEFYENDCRQIIITPPHTIMNFMPSKALLHSFSIDTKTLISPQDLAQKLILCGYESVEIVEMRGEFSLRGDILDIFTTDSNNPVRLSFFDKEIESMRYFDTQTQLSNQEELSCVKIPPAMFSLSDAEYNILESSIESMTHIDSFTSVEKSINAMGFWFLRDIGGVDFLREFSSIFTLNALDEYISNLDFVLSELRPSTPASFHIFRLPTHASDMDYIKHVNIANTIKLNTNKGVYIVSKSEAMLKLFDIEITNSIISPFFFNIRTKDSMFISLDPMQKTKRKKISLSLDSLKVGEFVIHSDYGIGVFECIKKVEVMGGLKDFISILYANEDRLLLPVENLNLIEKYNAYDSNIKIDRIGKSSFARLKDSIKDKLLAIANEIIRLQAQRELVQATIVRLDSMDKMQAYREFENKRGFILTSDQHNAIEDSLLDLQSGKVMDRLLNGDVGFGKTEVAMSLCFAVALNGLTSLIVVPTTLLCNQHFDTFKERLHNTELPTGKILKVVKIDRFTTIGYKKQLESALQQKEILIVIGTHVLFNLEISNVGLIVIDEEHKFGVQQKEILKQKSLTTHILSMSATPIPRTLNMAFSKLKSISELKEAPHFKQESKTFVKIKRDSLIKEAIIRELRRGGQVFYIYNNIAKIEYMKSHLLSLLPHLRILVLHSKINARLAEKGMLDFLHKQYDILLCTSIVESGIHLPNANTIIIDNAHNFGIADIHQLRGRVGRGKVIGFCYLLTTDDIGGDALKRLLAFEKNSFLGSGVALAYHDLEIRGGGNILGSAQSGHIKQVGFNMYVKMLEDTLNSLSKTQTRESHIDLKLSVSAFLSDTLITSERMRLDLYRRLSQASSPREVRGIESEIEQRFGKLDIYTMQFVELIIIKILALKLHIKAISNVANNICLTFIDNNRTYIKSETKDDDDILKAIKDYLQGMLKAS